MFSLLCASPNIVYLRVYINPVSSNRVCLLQYSQESYLKHQRGYVIHKSLESIIFYFIPLILQIYCYIRIAQQLFYVDETLQTSFNTLGNTANQRPKVFEFNLKKKDTFPFSNQKINFFLLFIRNMLMMKITIPIMMIIQVQNVQWLNHFLVSQFVIHKIYYE